MDIEALADQAARLRRGRTLLVVATVGALLALLGTMGNKPVLSIIGWATAVLGGLGGISESARALETPALAKFAGMVGALMPGLNLPLLAGFAWHSQRGLADLDATLRRETVRARRTPRASEPAARSEAPSRPVPRRVAAPPVAVPAATGPRQAVACVKAVLDAAAADQWCSLNLRPGAGAPGTPDALPAANQPLARVCGGHFVVVYLIDEGHQFRYVTTDDLSSAALKADELHELGLRNLEALVQGQPGLRTGREGAVNALLLGGHFEASLVLLDALWDGPLARQAPNGAVVALPARDICAFCDARSPEGIAQLRELARRVSANGDHLVTQRLFRRTGGRWTILHG